MTDPIQDIQGMILAAGLGTRFKPWTEKHPKALAVINGKSLLQRNVQYLQQFGIRDVVVNVHHFADQIMAAIDNNNGWGSRIRISDETDAVLETGGGLKKAAPLLTAPTIAVINVDILTTLPLNEIIEWHRQQQPLATLAVTDRETSRYLLVNENKELVGWRNVKTGEEIHSRPATHPRQMAFSGIHIIQRRMLDLIRTEGKLPVFDFYLEAAKTEKVLTYDHTGIPLIDVGKPEAVAKAEALFP